MKTYVEFNAGAGFPQGADLYYECQECHTLLSSSPNDNTHCACFNIRIDVEAGRMAVRDHALVRLVRIAPQDSSP